MHGFILGLSILFHRSRNLLLCQCHPVLITTALEYSLTSGSMMPPALFFLLETALVSGVFCGSIKILGLFYFCENAIGILVGIALNLWMILSLTHI